MTLTLGSLFDGIGGWQIAAVKSGVVPIWSSEIEPYPMAVTKKWFPNTKQLGDITKIDVDSLEPVDIVCAGSPCQDLSTAGKRKGLAGERSGLFVDSIKLVHRLRERTGKPRFFVWENVPGAFSSNRGADFRAVLEEIGQTEIPMPERNKWAQSGVVECDSCEIAWRVLDAQHWGVAQRRKRIFLVADFAAADRRAAEILFVEQGVYGNPPESKREGQGTAGGAEKGVNSAVVRMREGKTGVQTICWEMNEPNNKCRDYSDKTQAPTLTARMGTGGNQVPIVHCIAGNIIGREPKNGGNHLGVDSDVAFTLNTVDRHAVCVGNGQPHQAYIQDKVGALNTMHDQQCVMTVDCRKLRTVRRLTPTECERLQGWPDGYTDITLNGKPASDANRYKAIGNGMAQPCPDFVIRRIVEVVNKNKP